MAWSITDFWYCFSTDKRYNKCQNPLTEARNYNITGEYK